ncbi:unannotated protein [freshwater metagenome]|uniref:tRNA(Ile)-lysidine synthetase n=1 Tax=freshwater metagenome TaxID=449393 RepID=A0A6J7DK47_9ZZZZ|nr:tRNA lysidine(34) synthetase TilS [Actinomycetota bacterium]
MTGDLLERCVFPATDRVVALAVSGGADSVGMALLARAAGLSIHIHHVDHHLRAESARDAELVTVLATDLGVPVTVHDVHLKVGGNVESRARAARRSVLPPGVLTGHTMDDLAETMLLNLLWGAGLDGLSPMTRGATKPLIHLRRSEIRALVLASGRPFIDDPTNEDQTLRRNAMRHRILPALADVGERDIVPILARQAWLVADERAWLDEIVSLDTVIDLDQIDCRELQQWPNARVRRWVRHHLTTKDPDGTHAPSLDEVERVLRVIRGEVVATEVSGGRRVARKDQFLYLA